MQIYEKIIELAETRADCVLGVVVHAQGSTPQKIGAKALLDAAGTQWGTLGGGLVESEALERMRRALTKNAAETFEYRLDESYSREAGPICGGVMRILAHPAPTRFVQAYREALSALHRRESGVLATRLGAPNGEVVTVRWLSAADPTLPAEAIDAVLDTGQPAIVTSTEGVDYFLEPIFAPPRLLVVGGGHVGQEVVFQAVRLGFDVTVVDDRPEFADPRLFPDGVTVQSGDIRPLVSQYPQDHETYIILVSKGHRPDAEALEGCIRGGAKYIGMIGSKRKIRLMRKHFIEDGIATAEEFDRVVAPIGYDIGAVTVPEIGVSIAAQLVAARRKDSVEAATMRMRAAEPAS